MKKYYLGTDPVYMLDPEKTSQINLYAGKELSKEELKMQNITYIKQRNKRRLAIMLLGVITVLIIIPISLSPIFGIYYLADKYKIIIDSFTPVLLPILAAFIAYILYMLTKEQFFKVLD